MTIPTPQALGLANGQPAVIGDYAAYGQGYTLAHAPGYTFHILRHPEARDDFSKMILMGEDKRGNIIVYAGDATDAMIDVPANANAQTQRLVVTGGQRHFFGDSNNAISNAYVWDGNRIAHQVTHLLDIDHGCAAPSTTPSHVQLEQALEQVKTLLRA